MSTLTVVIDALRADGQDVDGLLDGLTDEQWKEPTPAPGWTVAHQVAHLTAVFAMAGLSASDGEKFEAMSASIGPDFSAAVEADLQRFLVLPPAELRAKFAEQRAETEAAIGAVPEDRILPWLVNPLPPAILSQAGMMELFAHGQDIADTVGRRRVPTERLVWVVDFIVKVKDFGYLSRGETPPPDPFRFEITGPDGDLWAFGPEDAEQRISGPAEDLCLLATRRRHHADLSIVAEGDIARGWLDIAQCYRGPAGEGRAPGQFASAHARA